MDTVIPALYASEPEAVPFGPSLEIRAFLLEREQGNLLIYRADTCGARRKRSGSWAESRASTATRRHPCGTGSPKPSPLPSSATRMMPAWR